MSQPSRSHTHQMQTTEIEWGRQYMAAPPYIGSEMTKSSARPDVMAMSCDKRPRMSNSYSSLEVPLRKLKKETTAWSYDAVSGSIDIRGYAPMG